MLKAKNRLHKNRDIKRVLQKGARVFGESVRISYLFGNKLNRPRITILVSTKVLKDAVDRNRLKRQIRARLRSAITTYPNLGFDMVVSITRNKPVIQVWNEIMHVLQKVGEAKKQ